MHPTLYVERRGSGPALVLLHGLFGSQDNLGALKKTLKEQFTVYAIDLPNHGRSGFTESTSLAQMAQDLIAWLDEQKLTKLHFVGHSLGGKVAMELALSRSTLVDKLVVMDIAPVAYENRHSAVFEALRSIQPETLRSRQQALTILTERLSEPATPAFLVKNLERASGGGFRWRMNLPVLDRDYPSLKAANVSEKVFAGPVLFLKGSESDYITEAYREAITSRFPSAQLRIIQDAGHWLHVEKPSLVANTVKRFLAK